MIFRIILYVPEVSECMLRPRSLAPLLYAYETRQPHNENIPPSTFKLVVRLIRS